MKSNIENSKFNTRLEPSDWRFSAAICGLSEYFTYCGIEIDESDEYIEYNSEDITEERYLKFVEYRYNEDDLHHKKVERILANEEISDEQIKIVNEKLVANTIMKKKFNKIKFDRSNKEQILKIIDDNRLEIIKETFRNKTNMYRNYCNTNQLFNDSQDYCRLVGYTIDVGKKGKSTGYNFSTSSFVGEDILEFDFIPFAFTGDRESFFINDNFEIQRLITSNNMLKNAVKSDIELDKNAGKNKVIDARKSLFKTIIESSDFIDYDVEVIYKERENDYFETLYLRKDSIDIFKNIKDYKLLCFSYKVTEKYYINVQKKVTDCIINNVLVDELIELFLKKEKNNTYLIKQLISINVLIRGDKNMEDRLKGAYACAKQVSSKLEQNKIDSYKQKLTSSIIFKDYDRVCQILLQLSNYSNIEFGFVYDLFSDFENNKDLAYTFINALSKENKEKTNN